MARVQPESILCAAIGASTDTYARTVQIHTRQPLGAANGLRSVRIHIPCEFGRFNALPSTHRTPHVNLDGWGYGGCRPRSSFGVAAVLAGHRPVGSVPVRIRAFECGLCLVTNRFNHLRRMDVAQRHGIEVGSPRLDTRRSQGVAPGPMPSARSRRDRTPRAETQSPKRIRIMPG